LRPPRISSRRRPTPRSRQKHREKSISSFVNLAPDN
jgi:hypothetical protein